jgi:hypothetical protein
MIGDYITMFLTLLITTTPSLCAGVEDFIALTPWDRLRGSEGILSVEDAARGMAECGLNVAGFVQPQDLDVCQKYGLRAIVSDRRVSDYDWRQVDPEQVDRNVQELVAEVGSHPAVCGFYVKDEPSAQEFAGLAVVVKALAKYAPDQLAYINLYPDYATINNADRIGQLGTDSYQEYLDQFVEAVPTPVLSYDNYSIEKDYSVRRSFFDNLLAVRRAAQASGRAFWNVITSNQVRPFRAAPTEGSLAFQVYTTLAAGGRGLAYYTYYTGDDTVPDAGGYQAGPLWNFQPTPVWTYLRTVNQAVRPLLPTLTRLTSKGVHFGPKLPAEGLPTLPGTVVEGIESERPMMIGEFVHQDGSAYVLVVNLDLLKGGEFILQLRDGWGPVQQVSSEDGSLTPLDAGQGLRLEPGYGVLLKVLRG